jgi:hypothetical protein
VLCGCGAQVPRPDWANHRCKISARDRRRQEEAKRQQAREIAARTSQTHPCPLGCGQELRGGDLHACHGRPLLAHEKAAADHAAAGLVAQLQAAGYEVNRKKG